jgi:hypothetical protein
MDYIEQLGDRLKASEVNGWSHATSLMAVRMTRHDTPEWAMQSGLFTGRTYQRTEVLDFTFHNLSDKPTCVYKTIRSPWQGANQRAIGYWPALGLLAQPWKESEFHNPASPPVRFCDGDTGAYPADCFTTAIWSVTSGAVQLVACGRHLGQVAESVAVNNPVINITPIH